MASARISSATSRPLAVTMKGRIASRAHSFKENILEALGHSQNTASGGPSSVPRATVSPHANHDGRVHLATKKKTNSSDNLLGYSESRRGTDTLVRDVQLSLRYFEDAVSKGTFELLPGCASIVLERIVGIQAFVSYENRLKDDPYLNESMRNLYEAVAKLTEWADSVLVIGAVEPNDNFRDEIVEPVRKAVIVLVNKVNQGAIAGDDDNTQSRSNFHNSLPDISSTENGKADGAESIPPKLPKRRQIASTSSAMDEEAMSRMLKEDPSRHRGQVGNHERHPHPPPLPPKLSRSGSRNTDATFGHIDWFSNPLFERTLPMSSMSPKYSRCETSFIDTQLPSPRCSLDTTLPDSADFPFMDECDDAGRDSQQPPALPVKENRSRKKMDSLANSQGFKPCMIGRAGDDLMGSSNVVKDQNTSIAVPKPLHSLSHLHGGGHAPLLNVLGGTKSFDCSERRIKTGPSGMTTTQSRDQGGERRNSDGSGPPPPLPPKKRDIINYMEMLGQSLLPTREDLMQSLTRTQMLLENVWAENYHQFGEFIPDNSAFNFPASQDLFTRNVDLSRLSSPGMSSKFADWDDTLSLNSAKTSNVPPALPPKKNRTHALSSSGERIVPIVRESDGSVVARKTLVQAKRCSTESGGSASTNSVCSLGTDSITSIESGALGSWKPHVGHKRIPSPPIILPESASTKTTPTASARSTPTAMSPVQEAESSATLPNNTSSRHRLTEDDVPEDSPLNRIQHEQTFQALTYGNNAEGILELRAGHVDELIILATMTTNRDFVYQDAFLLTYPTFISTLDLLVKLEYRFRKFNKTGDTNHLRAARSGFSLLVRVVDGMIDCDIQDPEVIRNLSSFMSELVSDGELLLARALRTKFIQKFEEHRAKLLPDLDFGRLKINQKPSSILQFKSSDLAEQITLMDAQYFWKLEPAELLLWVKEQNEDKSPNLVKFTKHFNDMSFWCRTKILYESDVKERERLVSKFIKIMKALRKHNNFNSYLAFLSALHSAPILRLDWSRSMLETIEEYSAIIDFAGSFKAYRDALANSRPPAIPYMGLALQDLTFVHIGNSDLVKDKINFAKRWQQYNILDNLRRFKRQSYTFQRREDVCQCFENFEGLSDNECWELSLKVKPRNRTSPVKVDHNGGGQEAAQHT